MGLTSISYISGWLFTCYIKGAVVIALTFIAIIFSKSDINMDTIAPAFIIYVIAVIH